MVRIIITQFSSLASPWWTWKTTWHLWKRSSNQLRKWLRSWPPCLMNIPKSDLVANKRLLEIWSPYLWSFAVYLNIPIWFQYAHIWKHIPMQLKHTQCMHYAISNSGCTRPWSPWCRRWRSPTRCLGVILQSWRWITGTGNWKVTGCKSSLFQNVHRYISVFCFLKFYISDKDLGLIMQYIFWIECLPVVRHPLHGLTSWRPHGWWPWWWWWWWKLASGALEIQPGGSYIVIIHKTSDVHAGTSFNILFPM